jgi:glycerophosphoryl diester phosphodiesterase
MAARASAMLVAMDAWRSRQGPLLYAHRGAPLEQPENSLEGFAAALACGADALEIDVHMTSDDHVVVAHDADGARTAAVARAIRACTLDQIKAWDIASGPGLGCPRRAACCMPTLDEVLAAFDGVPLNVDVKQSEPDMLAALLRVIAAHGAQERVLLTSFSSLITRRIRALGYGGPTGLGRAEAVAAVFAPDWLLRLRPLHGQRLQVPLRSGPLRLDRRELVDKLHVHDIAVDYWVVNDVSEAERLLEIGADGIVTDDTRAMAELFARSPRTAGWRARHGRDRQSQSS